MQSGVSSLFWSASRWARCPFRMMMIMMIMMMVTMDDDDDDDEDEDEDVGDDDDDDDVGDDDDDRSVGPPQLMFFMWGLDSSQVIHDQSHGFRPHRSCLLLTADW